MVGKGSIVRAGPFLSCWNSMDPGGTKTQELTQSHPEQVVYPLSPTLSFGVPSLFHSVPRSLAEMVSALWQDWWLNRCQETWGRILVPPLASYGTTSTLLNLSEPTSLCVKWLWSAYVLRVLWGLSKVYYLEKLLENSRCLIKCQTHGKLYNPFKLECRHW